MNKQTKARNKDKSRSVQVEQAIVAEDVGRAGGMADGVAGKVVLGPRSPVPA